MKVYFLLSGYALLLSVKCLLSGCALLIGDTTSIHVKFILKRLIDGIQLIHFNFVFFSFRIPVPFSPPLEFKAATFEHYSNVVSLSWKPPTDVTLSFIKVINKHKIF